MGHDVVVEISAEFTIEPFVEGAPGPHVRAAIDVAEAAGLVVDVGPFGTAVSGESESVLETVDAVVRAAIDAQSGDVLSHWDEDSGLLWCVGRRHPASVRFSTASTPSTRLPRRW